MDKNKQVKLFFKENSKKIAMNDFKVPCVIFENVEDANKWIRLKHTGENDGIGTVSWDAQQKARFEERTSGKSPYAMQALDFLRKQEYISDGIKQDFNQVPISSFQRLLSDPDVRDAFGLYVENGVLASELEPEEISKPLVHVIKDLLNPKFKVSKIYYKSDRKSYIESINQNELPNHKHVAEANWNLKTTVKPGDNSAIKGKRSLKLSANRNTIIPKSCVIHISNQRINKIYRELKDLNIKDYCNSVAITFRVFVELSIDEIIISKNIQGITVDAKLVTKVQKIAEYMKQGKHLTKDQLKGINVAVSNEHDILSINTFNSYVHGTKFNPIPDNLKAAWDNIEDFIAKVWELI